MSNARPTIINSETNNSPDNHIIAIHQTPNQSRANHFQGTHNCAATGMGIGFVGGIMFPIAWDIYTNFEANALQLFLVWMASGVTGIFGGAMVGGTLGLADDGLRFFSEKIRNSLPQQTSQLDEEDTQLSLLRTRPL